MQAMKTRMPLGTENTLIRVPVEVFIASKRMALPTDSRFSGIPAPIPCVMEILMHMHFARWIREKIVLAGIRIMANTTVRPEMQEVLKAMWREVFFIWLSDTMDWMWCPEIHQTIRWGNLATWTACWFGTEMTPPTILR